MKKVAELLDNNEVAPDSRAPSPRNTLTDGWFSGGGEEGEAAADPASPGRILLAALCRRPALLSPASKARWARDKEDASSIEDDANIPLPYSSREIDEEFLRNLGAERRAIRLCRVAASNAESQADQCT